jgi:ribosomal protein S27E
MTDAAHCPGCSEQQLIEFDPVGRVWNCAVCGRSWRCV